MLTMVQECGRSMPVSFFISVVNAGGKKKKNKPFSSLICMWVALSLRFLFIVIYVQGLMSSALSTLTGHRTVPISIRLESIFSFPQ